MAMKQRGGHEGQVSTQRMQREARRGEEALGVDTTGTQQSGVEASLGVGIEGARARSPAAQYPLQSDGNRRRKMRKMARKMSSAASHVTASSQKASRV